jgi:hypothetical protein
VKPNSRLYWQFSPSTRTDVTRSIGIVLAPELALLLRRDRAATRVLTTMPVISTRLPEYAFGFVIPLN